jgi:hypothetical protein
VRFTQALMVMVATSVYVRTRVDDAPILMELLQYAFCVAFLWVCLLVEKKWMA